MNLRRYLAKNYINFRGWSTSRKIVVIESDDWGSIRIPSKEVYNILLSNGIPVDKNYFTKYDCLESKEDLSLLFDVLSSVKDANGSNPVITANALVANPDFEQIEANNFDQYYFEPITNTYQRYFGNTDTLRYWLQPFSKKLLYPQFHGREHIGVCEWLAALKSGEEQERLGFKYRAILGLGNRKSLHRKKDYTAAFDYVSGDEKQSLIPIIAEGLELFEKTFGFKSTSFVAPGSIRGDYLDDTLYKYGIKYHQCGQQYEPDGQGSFKIIDRLWGDTNGIGQIYWRRNVTFEPTRNPNFNWIDSCMSEINIAFRWGKPAVINSHRVNFVGGIDANNRNNNLDLLGKLLKAIQSKWPNVEFMSSAQLGEIITESKNA